MKLPSLIPSLFCSGIIFTSAQDLETQHEPVQLEFRYQAGKSYVSKIVTKTSTKVMVEGQNMGTDQTITMDYTIKVDAIEESENVKVTFTYDRIAMTMNMMGQKMAFDSNDPDSLQGNPMAGIAGIAGKSGSATVTPEMEFIDLKGMDELFEGLGDGGPMARGMFSDEQLKQMMGSQIAAMMPGKPVKAGDQWPFQLVTPIGPLGNMTLEGKSTMKGLVTKGKSKMAVVEYASSVKTGPAEGQDQPGMAMEIKDGKMTSEYHFDLAEAYVTESETEMTMTLSMNAPGQEQKLSIPSTSTVTMTTKMK